MFFFCILDADKKCDQQFCIETETGGLYLNKDLVNIIDFVYVCVCVCGLFTCLFGV